MPFGAAVFAGDYIASPAAGLCQPIWEYDAKTLAWDLGAHPAETDASGSGTPQVRVRETSHSASG